MDFIEYQRLAARTINDRLTDDEHLLNAGMGLCGETGELLDAIKKKFFQGHDLSKQKVVDELGDILWYAAYMATCYNLSLDDVAYNNIIKLEKRYPNGFNPEHSINRKEETM